MYVRIAQPHFPVLRERSSNVNDDSLVFDKSYSYREIDAVLLVRAEFL
jgi:hypothetical protein